MVGVGWDNSTLALRASDGYSLSHPTPTTFAALPSLAFLGRRAGGEEGARVEGGMATCGCWRFRSLGLVVVGRRGLTLFETLGVER